MVATPPTKNLLSTIILAVAILAGVGVAAGIATAPGVMLDALVERSGLATFYPAALPVGVTTRTALALLAGGLVGAIGFAGSLTVRPTKRVVAVADPDEVDGTGGATAMELPPPIVRRADAHSDAPPRRPIRASSELGAPLPIAGEENARPITEPPSVPELVPEPVSHVAAPVVEPAVPAGPPPVAELPDDLDQPLAAFDPAAIPAEPLAPVRALPPLVRAAPPAEPVAVEPTPAPPVAQEEEDHGNESIGALLARLERGRLARRREAAVPTAASTAAEPVESLDVTLQRLRQLAAR